ncbi:MAG: trypsin-like peptidase domain-containing protein [Candidatus Nitrosopolaris sp.]
MMKGFAVATAILFAVAIIITISFDGFILPSTAVAQQQQINSPSQDTNSSNPLSLKTIFKRTENSVVRITSKTPTTISNSSNQSLSNTNILGSGFVYDKQGHITNGHVVGDAKVVYVTFPDGNRYTAKVIASDTYSDSRSTNFAEF